MAAFCGGTLGGRFWAIALDSDDEEWLSIVADDELPISTG
jgi:hypothetical protein